MSSSSAPSAGCHPLLVKFLPIWQWGDASGVFLAYDDENRVRLETAYQEDPCQSLDLESDGIKIRVDLVEMRQYTLDAGKTGAAHPIRRIDSASMNPPTWIEQTDDCIIVDCPPEHTDATIAKNAVLGSLGIEEFAIVLVQRIQNLPLYKRYELERSDMIRERGPGKLNERLLFHGSGKSIPSVIASDRDGFMAERSRDYAFYGKGCYFAEQARYSWHYRHWRDGTETGVGQILLCEVLCGNALEMGQMLTKREVNAIEPG